MKHQFDSKKNDNTSNQTTFQQSLREKYNVMLDRIEDLADVRDAEAEQ